MIKKLKKEEVFIFGSNLNGAHAGGAALQAFKSFGAVMGVGEGLAGQTYAFPTLDKNMQKVTETAFKESIKKLYKTAKENPDKAFLLTKVGCGIAGFDESWVESQFVKAPTNVLLPEDWRNVVAKNGGKILYKFLKEGMKSQHGNMTWEVGTWYKEKNIKICGKGFHASDTPLEALGYVQGEIVAKVEVRGESAYEDDKSCHSEMRVIDARKWQKKDSVAFSIFAAEQVIENFEKKYPDDKRPREAIEAAKKWLAAPTDANASAAYSAANSSYSANAAYAAANSANAANAACEEMKDRINAWIINHRETLEVIN